METPEGEIVLVPLDKGDNRRIAAHLALSMYAGEPCRICRQIIALEDLHTLVFAGYSRDGQTRAAHKVCWNNFIELLQTLPAAQLYELATTPEMDSSDGQRASSPQGDSGQ